MSEGAQLFEAVASAGRPEPTGKVVDDLTTAVASACHRLDRVLVGLVDHQVVRRQSRWLHILTVALAPAAGRAPTRRGSVAAVITAEALEAMRQEVIRL